MAAPISRSVVIRPVRSGFIITPSNMTSEPGTISAATIGNAAEDGSAGTTTGAACKFGLAGQRDAAAMRAIAARRDLGAEMARACSRCGRASPRVSITVVAPGASRPASSTADLICADGTGVRR